MSGGEKAANGGRTISGIKEKLSESELCPPDLLEGQEAAFARDIERLSGRRSEFVKISCPACDGKDSAPQFEKYTFSYVRCRACGTIYMNPRPSPDVMASYYDNSENYRYWAEHIFERSEDVRREKIHRPWLDRILGYCDRFHFHTGTLLEVGPGFGTFSALALESGKFREVVVIERTPEMAAACRSRGLTVIEMPVEEINTEVENVDVVGAFEVIEHLFSPADFLKQCVRLLRPGGLLIVSCPNGEGFDIAALGSLSLAVDPEHVNLFNPSSLARLAERCGFDVLEIETPGRLDSEFVRQAVIDGKFDLSSQPFLKRVLLDEWERFGWAFQQFLAEQGLSSHMWMAARKR